MRDKREERLTMTVHQHKDDVQTHDRTDGRHQPRLVEETPHDLGESLKRGMLGGKEAVVVAQVFQF